MFKRKWKGAQGLAEDVRYYGQWMRDEAEKRIGRLYPKVEITAEMAKERQDLKPLVGKKLTVIAWLWARTVKSPNPAFAQVDVPSASTFMLSTKPGKEAYVEPAIEGGVYRFTVKVGKPKDAEAAKNGTKLARGANFRCLMSGTPIAGDYIKAEGKAGRMGARLMTIVAEGERGRVYLASIPEHEAIAQQAQPDWEPNVEIPPDRRSMFTPLYGLTHFKDLFTPRQLVALTAFSDLVQEARERVKQMRLPLACPTMAVPSTSAATARRPTPMRWWCTWRLLVGAVQRLAGQGGDPVVQLQTNFGGGKTHSMLALYHLFSDAAPTELAGIDGVMQEAGVKKLPTAKRVVLVGNKISPGNPVTKPDGTVIRTLWGELAWQLGGKKAFSRVQADDEKATSPGDVLRALFNEYGPCLILIDEWVAYARQLHDQSDLPAGSFETQFSFAQVLTESAKLAKNCLLVISLPASDSSGSPHTHTEDVEVGGQRGREALDRLRNVVGRVEASWRPASAEEGFEIVRRRLFEPMTDPAQFKDRDVVARAFADLYRTQQQEFPPECRDTDYEKRMRAAYPIHPEIFDRLYTDWSTLVKFQRTRGVLRLMAAVIHSLWEKGDRNPLIQPANIPIDDPRVQFELTRYLSDNWVPTIEKDVDGPSSLPLRLDGDVPNLGKFAASRRVARTIYLGSAPTTTAANRGVEDRRVKLGLCDAGRVSRRIW